MDMRTPKMYIETSVFNSMFADDAPDMRRDAQVLFEEIRQGKYEPYTSEYVIQELLKCHEPRRGKMLELIDRYAVKTLPESDEAEHLASLYVDGGVIPRKYVADGLHIAAAAAGGMDLIVSFNFKHIVKRKTVTMTEEINWLKGYKRVGIYSPTEVIDHADE